MTPIERLALLPVCDAVIVAIDNPCKRVSIDALRRARHALDDEAFAVAQASIVIDPADGPQKLPSEEDIHVTVVKPLEIDDPEMFGLGLWPVQAVTREDLEKKFPDPKENA